MPDNQNETKIKRYTTGDYRIMESDKGGVLEINDVIAALEDIEDHHDIEVMLSKINKYLNQLGVGREH